MIHKAFVFDFQGFDAQLSKILEQALITNVPGGVLAFIRANVDMLKDPYEGEPLTPSWEALLEQKDVQEYGDFALTKFYNPHNDIGLGHEWQVVQETLSQRLAGDSTVVLGRPFGPSNNYFDPGRMGTYFQSPDQVRHNLERVEALQNSEPELAPTLRKLIHMLEIPKMAGQGLYVTF